MSGRPWPHVAIGLVAGAALQLMLPPAGYAVDCVSFGTLQNPTSTELARLNIKLTFVDDRMRMTNSLVFRKAGSSIDVDPAAACHKEGIDYSADADPLKSFGVSSAQMDAALDSLATIPALTDGDLDSLGCVAIVLLDSNGSSSRVFDSIMDEATALLAVQKLQQALAANDSAAKALAEAACRFGIASLAPGTDVSDRVEVTFSGARYRRSDGSYAVKASIQNISTTTLAGPAVLVVRFEGTVVATGPDGFTACNADPPATSYFRILTTGSSLAPNASTSLTLILVNPLRQVVRPLRLRVLSGIGG